MQLFQLLQVLDEALTPHDCKVHLATWNGSEHPLDVYFAGGFDDWQCWQSRLNFERKFVVSLIALGASKWLFAGAYDSRGSERVEHETFRYRYQLGRRPCADELGGRLVVQFERPSRQSYLNAELWADRLLVDGLRSGRMQIGEFPGFSRAMLTKQHLDLIVRQQIESWRAALASVAGVYVIADRRTGKLYVGSAVGEGGIWSRWCAYSAVGHGGNAELRELLKREGDCYAENFQFGVLEIADTHASANDVLIREAYWKQLLLSREHGYNSN